MGKRSAITRAIEYFENITPKSVEQYEAAHDAIEVLKQAKKDAARLDWIVGIHGIRLGNWDAFKESYYSGKHKGPRQAIDKAMRSEK